MKAIYLILGIVVFCSCSDFKRADQLEKVNLLINSVRNANELYVNSHFDSIPIILEEIALIENTIKKYYVDDTLDMIIADKLDRYKRIGLSLTSVYEKDSLLTKKINEELKNLENLKIDIENSSGDRANYDSNISFEEEKVEEIEAFTEECILTKKESMETFHNLHTDLQFFSDKLEMQNKEQ